MLSPHNQVIQTEWSLHREVFNLLCQQWHSPEVDLFATRYNNKLPKFVSPVPDPKAWAADAITLSWESLDMYAFPPICLLGNVVNKILSHDCQQIILIDPSWPNMPWFWDLVELSVQIPLCLPQQPSLVVQPLNGSRHSDLVGLNLHAWLLGSLLKDRQPGLSTKRSLPLFENLDRNIRHQADWSKVSLYLSSSFLSKNQLAWDGPDSVAPVVIPALSPSLDNLLRRIGPSVRLEHYAITWTKPRNFLSPLTKDSARIFLLLPLSSWIKQTVILCYKLSDQESLNLHQVKAHDVRAFAASRAFHGGLFRSKPVSLSLEVA